jgi:phosphotransferase system HPr (HPr) family protein
VAPPAGLDAGPADGKLGPKTQAAVKEFQQSKRLLGRISAVIVAVRAQLASRFRSNVSLAFNGRTANARDIFAVMMLAASVGSTIVIEADGPDETEAIGALASLIGDRSA